MVYFIETEKDILKVGWTRDVLQRVSSVLTYVSKPRLLALLEGTTRDEEYVHVQLWQWGLHLRGELFTLTPEVRVLLADLTPPHLRPLLAHAAELVARRTRDDARHMEVCLRRVSRD